MMLLCLATTPAFADGIQVKAAAFEADGNDYLLRADLNITLTHTLEEALNKGVALYFVTEFELSRSRWYWFDKKLVQLKHQYKLSYNALTRQYRLSVGNLFQNFATLQDAMGLMSQLRDRMTVDTAVLEKGETYDAALRMRLDVSQLPKPFQLNAFASKEWNLSSGWHRWEVTP
ncbi:MAG: DUF4390 domain-containing protein [Burkholderiales bacterium]